MGISWLSLQFYPFFSYVSLCISISVSKAHISECRQVTRIVPSNFFSAS